MRSLIDHIENSDNQKLLWILIGMLTAFAFAQRYPMDDAFISFRYAKFLAQGEGLVWNVGEKVEGYSNFLWTVLLAGGLKADIPPERFAVILSFPAYIAVLWMTFRLTAIFSSSKFAALAAVIFVGFNRSVYAFATSGMETTLVMCQFLAIIWMIAYLKTSRWSVRGTAILSILIALSVLTRLDAAIPGAIALWTFYKSDRWRERRVLSAAVAPLVLLILPWIIWKVVYYGSLTPNSFNIKVQGFEGIFFGLFYLNLFCLANLLHAHLGLLFFNWKSLKNRVEGAREALIFVVLWIVYTVSVGGDFMEFRFFNPLFPILIALIIAVVWNLTSPALKAALMTILALGALQSNFALDRLLFGYGVESVSRLREHLTGKSENWILIGKKLKEHFGESDVVISAGAAGAIPYFSELKAVDFLGLTDKEIAFNNEPFSNVPGHLVICSLDHLVRRGVHLIVEPNNHMMLPEEYSLWQRGLSWREAYTFYLDPDKKVRGGLIDRIRLVAMPVDESGTLILWYLTPHPAIDAAIVEHKWREFTISRW